MLIGYARVSTLDQDYSSQIKRLKAAGAEKVYAEKKTGTELRGRHELTRLLDALRDGDVVLVVKLDRLGRDLLDILRTVEHIHANGCSIRVIDQGIDTVHTWGRKFLELLGWVADVEMTLRRKRQAAGVQRAKAEGKYKGRKRRVTRERVTQLKDEGLSVVAIARQLGVSRQAVYKCMTS